MAPTGEQIAVHGRTRRSPPHAQNFKQAWGKHRIPVLLSLALLDAKQHALGIDIADLECDSLRDAQAGAIAGHENRAMFEAGDVIEEEDHFFMAEHDREFVRAAHTGKLLIAPRHSQRREVQEPGRGYEGVDAFGRQLPVVGQIKHVLPHVFQVQMLGAGLEIVGITGYIMDIVLLGGRREVA